jgi:hypothetical protein
VNEAQWLASDDPAAMYGHLLHGASVDGDAYPVVTQRKLRLFACGCARLVWDRLRDKRSRRAVEVAEAYADGAATRDELAKAQHAAYYLEPQPGAEGSPERYAAYMTANLCSDDPLRFLRPNYLHWPARSGVSPAAQAGLLRCVVNPFRAVTITIECPACGGEGREHGFGLTDYSRRCRTCPPVGNGSYRGTGKVRVPWLTPTVLALAREAYGGAGCKTCKGKGWRYPGVEADDDEWACATCGRASGQYGHFKDGKIQCPTEPCQDCAGVTPAPFRAEPLPILADALEDAGCTEESVLRHLRGWELAEDPDGHTHHLIWRKTDGPHARGCWALDLVLGKE